MSRSLKTLLALALVLMGAAAHAQTTFIYPSCGALDVYWAPAGKSSTVTAQIQHKRQADATYSAPVTIPWDGQGNGGYRTTLTQLQPNTTYNIRLLINGTTTDVPPGAATTPVEWQFVPTFHSIGLCWAPANKGPSPKVAEVRYRAAGTSTYSRALDLWYDGRTIFRRDAEFRGSVVDLQPNTPYEFKLTLRASEGGTVLREVDIPATQSSTTLNEQFTVSRHLKLPIPANGPITKITLLPATAQNPATTTLPTNQRELTIYVATGEAGYTLITPDPAQSANPDYDLIDGTDAVETNHMPNPLPPQGSQARGAAYYNHGKNSCILVNQGVQQVILRGMRMQNCRRHGVLLWWDATTKQTRDIVIEDNSFTRYGGFGLAKDDRPNNDAGVTCAGGSKSLVAKPQRIIIQRNRFFDPRHNSTHWGPCGSCDSDHAEGPQAVLLAECGTNHVIRYNDIVGHGDPTPVTFTVASSRVNWTAHRVPARTPIVFAATSGTLPGGLSADTRYFVVNPQADSFQVSNTPTGAPITLSGSAGGSYTVTTQKFFMDAIGGAENFWPTGFPAADSDIYQNRILHAYDDGIEADGGNRNVRIWGNYFDRTFVPISNAANIVGPLYVWRNVANSAARLRYDPAVQSAYDPHYLALGPDNGDRGPFIKGGGKGNGSIGTNNGGRAYYFHNTALQLPFPGISSNGGVGYGLANHVGGGTLYNFVSHNNIWQSHRQTNDRAAIDANHGGFSPAVDPAIHDTSTISNDLINQPIPFKPSTVGNPNATGISGTPTYANLVLPTPASGTGDFTLASGSPGREAARALDNFNQGASSDVGAHQSGTPAMKFGRAAGGLSVRVEQASGQADPAAAGPINFTAVFSQPVSDFTSADVVIGGTAGGNKTATVSGSGTTYTIAVDGMTSAGTVTVSIPAGAASASGSTNSASTSGDNVVTFGSGGPPSVTINQASSQVDPAVGGPINFTVVFSQPVSGFTGSDVTIAGTAGGTKTATVSGDGASYSVAVTGMTTSGTVIASIAAGVAQNSGGVGNSASTSTDNQVTFNAPGPSVTINQAAGQADPTTATTVNFAVVFSESVSGFAANDVTIGGTAGGSKSAVVTGSGASYNVAISGMTTSGTVTATIGAGVAQNAGGAGNSSSTSTDNVVTINLPGPSVTINQAAAQPDPAESAPVNFTAVFSEAVTGFTGSDVTITGTAGGTKTAVVSGSGTTYNVAVSGMTTSGTVLVSIAAGVAQNAGGSLNSASTSSDNQVTFGGPAFELDLQVTPGPTITRGAGETVTFTVNNPGLQSVSFYLDDVLQLTDTSAPYQFAWTPSASAGLGPRNVRIEATNGTNHAIATRQLYVLASACSVIPAASSVVQGQPLTVEGLCSSAKSVKRVRFLVDNVMQQADTTSSYTWTMDTSEFALGSHSVGITGVIAGTPAEVEVNDAASVEITAGALNVTFSPGATLRRGEEVTISAVASDGRPLKQVDFYVNGQFRWGEVVPPYQYKWSGRSPSDTANDPPSDPFGRSALVVHATDMSGNVLTATRDLYMLSGVCNLLVANSAYRVSNHDKVYADRPALWLGQPIVLDAVCSAFTSVQKIEYYVNGTLKGTETIAPWPWTLDTAGLGAGMHTITMKAYAGGAVASEQSLSIEIIAP